MAAKTTRIAAAGAGVLLLVAAGYAAVRGLAGVFTDFVDSKTAHLADGARVDARAWRSAAAFFSSPFGGAPGDADLSRALAGWALLHSGRGTATAADPEGVVEAFRGVVRLRPSWGKAWARLAYTKAVLDQHDDEFALSLRQAARLAPREVDVRTMILHAGLAGWYGLPEPLRQEVWAQVRQGLADRRLRARTIAMAVEYGLADFLAPDLDAAEKARVDRMMRSRAERSERESGASR